MRIGGVKLTYDDPRTVDNPFSATLAKSAEISRRDYGAAYNS